MASRGSVAINKHITTTEYKKIDTKNYGIKILTKNSKGPFALTDYSHSKNTIYAKVKSDGKTLHEMRFYDDNHNIIIEIGYHFEPKLDKRQKNILHYHTYNGLNRSAAIRMDKHPEVLNKYKKYLKEFGL